MELPPWFVPYVMLAVLWLGEVPTWSGYRERSQRSEQDKLSTLFNTLAGYGGWAAALMLAGWGRQQPWARLPGAVAWLGVALVLAGVAFRVWAIRTLGQYFTLTIQVRADQPVIDRGPYRLIRHPSYAGADLALIGIGLTCGNWISTLLFVIPMFVAHLYRIRVEELALLETLGEPYRQYMARTKRLIPFVY